MDEWGRADREAVRARLRAEVERSRRLMQQFEYARAKRDAAHRRVVERREQPPSTR